MKLSEIYRSQNYYSVCKSDRVAGLVLYVIAGGVMMYEVVVALTPDEEDEFRRLGHLDALARDICGSESKYADRTLRPLQPGEKIEFDDAA